MQILKKKNIILSSILFSAAASFVLFSCGSPSSRNNETFYNVAACDEAVPSRFTERTNSEVPVELSELEDGTYAFYHSEIRVETTVKNHTAKFQTWEKISKQPAAIAGAPTYSVQQDWGCISAKDALAEKPSFVVEAVLVRIFKKSAGRVEWINRKVGIYANQGAAAWFFNDPLKSSGREPNGKEKFEVEILKSSANEFNRGLEKYWDESSFSQMLGKTFEFHGKKRIDANTVIYARIVYERQRSQAADVEGDLFIPLPTVDVLH